MLALATLTRRRTPTVVATRRIVPARRLAGLGVIVAVVSVAATDRSGSVAYRAELAPASGPVCPAAARCLDQVRFGKALTHTYDSPDRVLAELGARSRPDADTTLDRIVSDVLACLVGHPNGPARHLVVPDDLVCCRDRAGLGFRCLVALRDLRT